MQQVITVQPDGTMSGLQRKKGQGLDLRQFGHANIERVSEISWDVRRQRWYVEVLGHHSFSGVLTAQCFHAAGVEVPETTCAEDVSVFSDAPCELLTFEDYDDAVKAEVAYLDALRVRGTF